MDHRLMEVLDVPVPPLGDRGGLCRTGRHPNARLLPVYVGADDLQRKQ